MRRVRVRGGEGGEVRGREKGGGEIKEGTKGKTWKTYCWQRQSCAGTVKVAARGGRGRKTKS